MPSDQEGGVSSRAGRKPPDSQSLQARTAALLDRAAEWLERSPAVLLLPLFALYAVHAWTASLHRQLWHDEIFTYLIARSPDWHTLLQATHRFDLNPPLSHLLVRGSLKAFAPLLADRQATRLPFMLGVAGCGALVYLTLHRWTGSRVWSALGLSIVFWAYQPYAIEARPYALQALFLAAAAWAWVHVSQTAAGRDPRRSGWLVVLALSLAAGLLTHVFFALLWLGFALAATVHLLARKRLDTPLIAALLAPLPVTWLYRPLLAQHAVSYFPLKYQPKLLVAGWFYLVSGWQLVWILLPGLGCAALLGRYALRGRTEAAKAAHAPRLSAAPWLADRSFLALLLGIGAMPGILILYLHITHGAFFWRYGFSVFFALALLVPLSLWRLARGRPATGLLLLASAALLNGDVRSAGSALLHPREAFAVPPQPPCAACELADRLAPGLPLVDANGLDWVEMNLREPPARLRNVYYLTGRAEAIQYAHATLFEGIPEERSGFAFLAPTEPYAQFVAAHPRFVVYGTRDAPEQWLLRKLAAAGAHLTLLGNVDPSDYHDSEVWLVGMPPQ